MSAHAQQAEQRAMPLELLFDLVFVFAITRVAAAAALVCVPLATQLDALVALAVTCALVAALIAYETVRGAADRMRVRMEA